MPRIAVLIPCYNEEKTVAKVVRDFRTELPEADIYVYDNNSSDATSEEAARAGAIVRKESRQGKGYVVRAMFSQIDADIYVMVDGDSTYPADRVHDLISPIWTGEADMVNGSRLHAGSESRFRQLNLFGNRLFISLLNLIFKVRLTDLLSGYRAFNRKIVKSLPLLSRGFEIETELTMKAIERDFRVAEVPVNLTERPEGSSSKIKIVKDGILILSTLFSLFRDYKPLTAFGLLGGFIWAAGMIPGVVVVREYLLSGYIRRVPSAILAVGLVLSGLLVIIAGLVLHTIARRFQEHDRQLQNLMEEILGRADKK
jgi:glycosyltransferase involved in cell wall biosynthesis